MPLNSTGTPRKKDVLNSIMEVVEVTRTDSIMNKVVCHAVKSSQNLNHSLNLNQSPNNLKHIILRESNLHRMNHVNQIQGESVINQKMLETVTIGSIDTGMTRKRRDVKRLLMEDATETKTTSTQNQNVNVNVSVLALYNRAAEVEDVMTTSPDGISMKGIISVMNSNSLDVTATKTISSRKTNVCSSVQWMTTIP